MLCLIATLHVVALIMMAATEADLVDKAAFLLVWAVLNFFWLALVRRPAVAALISLELVVALTLLSRFKYDKLWMTVDFVDLMIIDQDTSAFLLAAFPSLRGWIALAATVTAALLIAAWRLDRYRVRRAHKPCRRFAMHGCPRCPVAVVPDRSRMRISSARTMFRNSRGPASRRSMNLPTTDFWRRTRA